jgi:uncharacterized Ntn-hydrolase superfamily protein
MFLRIYRCISGFSIHELYVMTNVGIFRLNKKHKIVSVNRLTLPKISSMKTMLYHPEIPHRKTSKVMNGLVAAILLILLMGGQSRAQDTFSIVAVDTLTGEIGSAGASCVTSSPSYPHGAAILSDVIPGIGAIHTQAAWLSANQVNAHNHMMAGESPQQIIAWLVAHDAQGNPSTRQYGIVDFRNNTPRAAAYTGNNCSNYKNDTANIFYAIQGNILLGQRIIDSMQNRFLNTQGTLGDRLMAALQGAKVIGADTRCAPRHSSSLSSFLRLARPNNRPDSLHIDLWMAYPSGFSGIVPVDPIDSLQTLYDHWKTITSVFGAGEASVDWVKIITGADRTTSLDFSRCPEYSKLKLVIFDLTGRVVLTRQIDSPVILPFPAGSNHPGMFIYQVLRQDNRIVALGKFLTM